MDRALHCEGMQSAKSVIVGAQENAHLSAKITIRDSTVCDVYALASNLRPADRAEVEALGISPRDGIRRSYRHAILRRTYLIDGEIAAMSGLCGAMLSDIGEPYLMTTPIAATMPISFVKLARDAVDEMLAQRMRLEGYVAASYTGAIRLLDMLGFSLGEPRLIRNTPFRKYVRMRDL